MMPNSYVIVVVVANVPTPPSIKARGECGAHEFRLLCVCFECVCVLTSGRRGLPFTYAIPYQSQGCHPAPPPPSAHLRLILREHKIFPAKKESNSVYIGTSS